MIDIIANYIYQPTNIEYLILFMGWWIIYQCAFLWFYHSWIEVESDKESNVYRFRKFATILYVSTCGVFTFLIITILRYKGKIKFNEIDMNTKPDNRYIDRKIDHMETQIYRKSRRKYTI